MYTIREWEVEHDENVKVHHVWFMVKTLEEAEAIILKRVFGNQSIKNPITGWYNKVWTFRWCGNKKIGWSGYGGDLRLFKENDNIYDLDEQVGPSTIIRYIITEED